jgi:uncharacterized protein DUF664
MSPQTPIPEANYAQKWPGDARPTLPLVADEREFLVTYLDYYRATLEQKVTGVPVERLNEATMPPSRLTLHGLVRHIAGVEQWWFHYQFAGNDSEHLYYSDDWPDQDFEDLSGPFEDALTSWRGMCARSREIVATHSLDDTGTLERTGDPISLRAIMLKMIVEYARHCGHADLLREAIDGTTGH